MKSLTILLAAGVIAASCPSPLSAADKAHKTTWSFNEKQKALYVSSEATDAEFAEACAKNPTAEKLSLSSTNPKGRSLAPLAKLNQLKELTVKYQVHGGSTRPAFDLAPLAGLTELKELRLECAVKNTAALGKLTNLEFLIIGMDDETSVEFLKGTPNLKTLHLDNCKKPLPDLSPLKEAKKLRSLGIRGSTFCKVGTSDKELEAISELPELTVLELGNNPKMTNLNFLRGCPKLERLLMMGFCDNVTDISGVKTCTELKDVWMMCEGVKDLSPLKSCTKLKYARFEREMPKAQIESLKAALPKLRVSE